MTTKIEAALIQAREAGVDFNTDFHAQNIGQLMSELARKYGYRVPRNSSGSTGRHFFYRLQSEYDKRKEN